MSTLQKTRVSLAEEQILEQKLTTIKRMFLDGELPTATTLDVLTNITNGLIEKKFFRYPFLHLLTSEALIIPACDGTRSFDTEEEITKFIPSGGGEKIPTPATRVQVYSLLSRTERRDTSITWEYDKCGMLPPRDTEKENRDAMTLTEHQIIVFSELYPEWIAGKGSAWFLMKPRDRPFKSLSYKFLISQVRIKEGKTDVYVTGYQRTDNTNPDPGDRIIYREK